MSDIPSGTVTFLFTDIEGSTELWERFPDAMRIALARHDGMIRDAIEGNGGHVFKTVGDAFCAAFPTARSAVSAALKAQQCLLDEQWGETGPIRVRMGIHTGSAQLRDGDYYGPTLNRVARLQNVGYGQQILLSQSTYELVCEQLHPGTSLIDLGMHRLKDLAAPEHVWQLCHPSLVAKFAPLRSLDYLPTNLPAQTTSFIGREHEIAAVKELLGRSRLLTLTGSGGSGKTRLALQASADVLAQYPDGVWLVQLAVVIDPSLIAPAVAESVGVREAPGQPIVATLLSFLKDKQMLLVLDNCEHLLDASAMLADSLLRSCPKVFLLATSREALGIAGESAYRIPSLAVPSENQEHTPHSLSEFESVRLFTERAASVNSDFEFTAVNAAALASVCRRLDGIPLAIELAAARVRAMPVEEINARLDNCFRLLTGGSRTALPRQQTLRSLIDWSYDLLTEAEKLLLCRVSVFSGGFSLPAAEHVCSGADVEEWEVLDLLTALVDKSLVAYGESAGKGRFRMLETVRQYTRERLAGTGASDAVRQRHRDYFLSFAQQARASYNGSDQAQWLRRLDEEHDNLRGAVDWTLSGECTGLDSLRFCAAMSWFWETRGHYSEAKERLLLALRKPDAQVRTLDRAKALNGAGNQARRQSDYSTARACYEEALSINQEISDRRGVGVTLNNLGLVSNAQNEYDTARVYYEESLAVFREIEDGQGIAAELNNLGEVAWIRGDLASARGYCEESLSVYREIGDSVGLTSTLGSLGGLAFLQGNYDQAQTYFEESLAIGRDMGNRSGIASSLGNLANVAFRQGNLDLARALFEEGLSIARDVGDRIGIAYSLFNLGEVIAEMGDHASACASFRESLSIAHELGNRRNVAYCLEAFAKEAANNSNWAVSARLWGAADALRQQFKIPLDAVEQDQSNTKILAVRQALGEDAFAAAWKYGREMALDEAIAQAMEYVSDEQYLP